MKQRILREVKQMRFGLVYTGLAVVGSVIYTWLDGPLFGRMDAAAIAFMVLAIGALAIALLIAFFRQPNPYTRIYYRYELMDVPEVLRGKLDTGPVDWLWQVVPMVVVAVLLLPFFA